MSVADWLKGLDLGQYAQAFADNDIDLALAATLTDADLKEIGVASLGHRRKLLAAAAALTAKPPAPQPTPPPPPPGQDAERRPITVMFCDLVGSTSLAAKLDPEDWRNLVGGYPDAALAAVTSLGGQVLKKLGDGLMDLFGYPQAQENDGERAVRAALAIQRALADLNARNAATGAPKLAARIGLESGRVVVDSTGEVYGEAPNVAARVQSAAAPGETWITRAAHRQIAGLFVVEDKGEHELKGVPERTWLYRIVRISGGGRRGGSRAPTPLIGRGEELDILVRRWDRARRGEGQLALIVGEPGLGKSRLVEEFRARLAETPHTWVEWSSSQLLQNTPLHPIGEWGRQRFGGADVAAGDRLAELEQTLGQVGLDPAEYIPLLAPLLDIPLPPAGAPALAPEEFRRRQLAAILAWVLAGARAQPIVLAFEDLQWADPTSLDVLRGLAERGAQVPLFLLATARPEFRAPWSLRSHHSVVSLAPLDRMQVALMVAELASRHALAKDIVDGVCQRAEGVPLFVEEVTRLLLERGERGGAQAIPMSLQQSLVARLDRLGEAREVAQVGSVLGRDFSYKLLREVAESGEAALQAALESLAEADILFVEGAAPEATYRFKHALIQDAAYDSLLKSRRLALHKRAAEVLSQSGDAEPEIVAHHFTQAGLTDDAIDSWGKAGDQALRRSAFQEAMAHLGKAVEMADKMAEARTPIATAQRAKMQTDYAHALYWGKGQAAAETKAAFDRIRELPAGKVSDEERLSEWRAQWGRSIWGAQLLKAQSLAERLLRDAGIDNAAKPFGSYAVGTTCLFLGRFADARVHLETALSGIASDATAAIPTIGLDLCAAATSYLALSTFCSGHVARGFSNMEEAIGLANSRGHPPSQAHCYVMKALLAAVCDDFKSAIRAGDAALTVSR